MKQQKAPGLAPVATPIQEPVAEIAPAAGPLTPDLARTAASSHGNAFVQSEMGGDEPADGDGTFSLGAFLAASAGEALPGDLAAKAEHGLGRSFGDVRIHRGPEADAITARLGVRALAAGTDIVVGRGGDAPHVLVHELAHVAQQGGAAPGDVDESMASQEDAAEDEADEAAQAVLAGESFEVASAAPRVRGSADGPPPAPAAPPADPAEGQPQVYDFSGKYGDGDGDWGDIDIAQEGTRITGRYAYRAHGDPVFGTFSGQVVESGAKKLDLGAGAGQRFEGDYAEQTLHDGKHEGMLHLTPTSGGDLKAEWQNREAADSKDAVFEKGKPAAGRSPVPFKGTFADPGGDWGAVAMEPGAGGDQVDVTYRYLADGSLVEGSIAAVITGAESFSFRGYSGASVMAVGEYLEADGSTGVAEIMPRGAGFDLRWANYQYGKWRRTTLERVNGGDAPKRPDAAQVEGGAPEPTAPVESIAGIYGDSTGAWGRVVLEQEGAIVRGKYSYFLEDEQAWRFGRIEAKYIDGNFVGDYHERRHGRGDTDGSLEFTKVMDGYLILSWVNNRQGVDLMAGVDGAPRKADGSAPAPTDTLTGTYDDQSGDWGSVRLAEEGGGLSGAYAFGDGEKGRIDGVVVVPGRAAGEYEEGTKDDPSRGTLSIARNPDGSLAVSWVNYSKPRDMFNLSYQSKKAATWRAEGGGEVAGREPSARVLGQWNDPLGHWGNVELVQQQGLVRGFYDYVSGGERRFGQIAAAAPDAGGRIVTSYEENGGQGSDMTIEPISPTAIFVTWRGQAAILNKGAVSQPMPRLAAPGAPAPEAASAPATETSELEQELVTRATATYNAVSAAEPTKDADDAAVSADGAAAEATALQTDDRGLREAAAELPEPVRKLLGTLVPGRTEPPLPAPALATRIYDLPERTTAAVVRYLDLCGANGAAHKQALEAELAKWREDGPKIDAIKAALDEHLYADEPEEGIESTISKVESLAADLSERGKAKMLGDANYLNSVAYVLGAEVFMRVARCFALSEADLAALAPPKTEREQQVERLTDVAMARPIAEKLLGLREQVRTWEGDPSSFDPHAGGAGLNEFIRDYNGLAREKRALVELVYDELPTARGAFRDDLDAVVRFEQRAGAVLDTMELGTTLSAEQLGDYQAAAAQVQVAKDVEAARQLIRQFNDVFGSLLQAGASNRSAVEDRMSHDVSGAGGNDAIRLNTAIRAYNTLERPAVFLELYPRETCLQESKGFEGDLDAARGRVSRHADLDEVRTLDPEEETRRAVSDGDRDMALQLAAAQRQGEQAVLDREYEKRQAYLQYREQNRGRIERNCRTVHEELHATVYVDTGVMAKALPARLDDPNGIRTDFEVRLFRETWEGLYPGEPLDTLIREKVVDSGEASEYVDRAQIGAVRLTTVVKTCENLFDDNEDQLWAEIESRGPAEWKELLEDEEALAKMRPPSGYLSEVEYNRVINALMGKLRLEDIVATRDHFYNTEEDALATDTDRYMKNAANLTANLGPGYLQNLLADEGAMTAVFDSLDEEETLGILQKLGGVNARGADAGALNGVYDSFQGAGQGFWDEANTETMLAHVRKLDDVARLKLKSDPSFQRLLDHVAKHGGLEDIARIDAIEELLGCAKGDKSEATMHLREELRLAAQLDQEFHAAQVLMDATPAQLAQVRGDDEAASLAKEAGLDDFDEAVSTDVMVRLRWSFRHAGDGKESDAESTALRLLLDLRTDPRALARGGEVLDLCEAFDFHTAWNPMTWARVQEAFSGGGAGGACNAGPYETDAAAREALADHQSRLSAADLLLEAGALEGGTEENAMDELFENLRGAELLYSFSNIGEWIELEYEVPTIDVPGGETVRPPENKRDYVRWAQGLGRELGSVRQRIRTLRLARAGDGGLAPEVAEQLDLLEAEEGRIAAVLRAARPTSEKILGFVLDLHPRVYKASTWDEVGDGGLLQDEEGGARLQALRDKLRGRLKAPETDPELHDELDKLGFLEMMTPAYRAWLDANYELDAGVEQREAGAFVYDGEMGSSYDHRRASQHATMQGAVSEFGFALDGEETGLKNATDAAASWRGTYQADKAQAASVASMIVEIYATAVAVVVGAVAATVTGGAAAVLIPALVSAATSAAGILVSGVVETGIRGKDVAFEDYATQAATTFATDFVVNVTSAGLFKVLGPAASMAASNVGKAGVDGAGIALEKAALQAADKFRDSLLVQMAQGGLENAAQGYMADQLRYETMGGARPKGKFAQDFIKGSALAGIEVAAGVLKGTRPSALREAAIAVGKSELQAGTEIILTAWREDHNISDDALWQAMAVALVQGLAEAGSDRALGDQVAAAETVNRDIVDAAALNGLHGTDGEGAVAARAAVDADKAAQAATQLDPNREPSDPPPAERPAAPAEPVVQEPPVSARGPRTLDEAEVDARLGSAPDPAERLLVLQEAIHADRERLAWLESLAVADRQPGWEAEVEEVSRRLQAREDHEAQLADEHWQALVDDQSDEEALSEVDQGWVDLLDEPLNETDQGWVDMLDDDAIEPVPAVTTGTAEAIEGSQFHGQRNGQSHREVDPSDLRAAVDGLRGRMDVANRDGVEHLDVDGRKVRVVIAIAPSETQEVARYTRETDADGVPLYRVIVSPGTDPADLQRAIAHELAEIRHMERKVGQPEASAAAGALKAGADPDAPLTAHDVGRLAELDVVASEDYDPVRRASETEHLVEHLGLADERGHERLARLSGELTRDAYQLVEAEVEARSSRETPLEERREADVQHRAERLVVAINTGGMLADGKAATAALHGLQGKKEVWRLATLVGDKLGIEGLTPERLRDLLADRLSARDYGEAAAHLTGDRKVGALDRVANAMGDDAFLEDASQRHQAQTRREGGVSGRAKAAVANPLDWAKEKLDGRKPDTGVALDAIASLPPDQRVELLATRSGRERRLLNAVSDQGGAARLRGLRNQDGSTELVGAAIAQRLRDSTDPQEILRIHTLLAQDRALATYVKDQGVDREPGATIDEHAKNKEAAGHYKQSLALRKEQQRVNSSRRADGQARIMGVLEEARGGRGASSLDLERTVDRLGPEVTAGDRPEGQPTPSERAHDALRDHGFRDGDFARLRQHAEESRRRDIEAKAHEALAAVHEKDLGKVLNALRDPERAAEEDAIAARLPELQQRLAHTPPEHPQHRQVADEIAYLERRRASIERHRTELRAAVEDLAAKDGFRDFSDLLEKKGIEGDKPTAKDGDVQPGILVERLLDDGRLSDCDTVAIGLSAKNDKEIAAILAGKTPEQIAAIQQELYRKKHGGEEVDPETAREFFLKELRGIGGRASHELVKAAMGDPLATFDPDNLDASPDLGGSATERIAIERRRLTLDYEFEMRRAHPQDIRDADDGKPPSRLLSWLPRGLEWLLVGRGQEAREARGKKGNGTDAHRDTGAMFETESQATRDFLDVHEVVLRDPRHPEFEARWREFAAVKRRYEEARSAHATYRDKAVGDVAGKLTLGAKTAAALFGPAGWAGLGVSLATGTMSPILKELLAGGANKDFLKELLVGAGGAGISALVSLASSGVDAAGWLEKDENLLVEAASGAGKAAAKTELDVRVLGKDRKESLTTRLSGEAANLAVNEAIDGFHDGDVDTKVDETAGKVAGELGGSRGKAPGSSPRTSSPEKRSVEGPNALDVALPAATATFATDLEATIASQCPDLPAVKVAITTDGVEGRGQYDFRTGTLKLRPELLKEQNTAVGRARLKATIAHELRHAEQAWAMARRAAGRTESPTVAMVMDAAGVSSEVARRAIQEPMRDPDPLVDGWLEAAGSPAARADYAPIRARVVVAQRDVVVAAEQRRKRRDAAGNAQRDLRDAKGKNRPEDEIRAVERRWLEADMLHEDAERRFADACDEVRAALDQMSRHALERDAYLVDYATELSALAEERLPVQARADALRAELLRLPQSGADPAEIARLDTAWDEVAAELEVIDEGMASARAELDRLNRPIEEF